MKMQKNWWKKYQKNGKSISRHRAKKLLLPGTNEFRGKHRRWDIEDLVAYLIVFGGSIFIAAEAIQGNSSPAWGVEAATTGVGLLMAISIIMLIGHRIERNTILHESYYKAMYDHKLRSNGYSLRN
jgi:preprotein translocase subunit SecY